MVSFTDFLLLVLTQSVWHQVWSCLEQNSRRGGTRAAASEPDDNKRSKNSRKREQEQLVRSLGFESSSENPPGNLHVMQGRSHHDPKRLPPFLLSSLFSHSFTSICSAVFTLLSSAPSSPRWFPARYRKGVTYIFHCNPRPEEDHPQWSLARRLQQNNTKKA